MKVDMSPEGISRRLHAMGDLWQLSVALMTSKPADGSPRSGRGRALEIQESIRSVMLQDWDPIGVGEIDEARDEYDSYIAPVYRILVGTRSVDELAECLSRIEREEMGIGPSDPEVLQAVSAKLLDLKVTLD